MPHLILAKLARLWSTAMHQHRADSYQQTWRSLFLLCHVWVISSKVSGPSEPSEEKSFLSQSSLYHSCYLETKGLFSFKIADDLDGHGSNSTKITSSTRMLKWRFLKIRDAQVTMSFNTKSWSSMTGWWLAPYNFGKLQILNKWTNDFSVFIRARSAAPRLWLLDSDFAAGSWHDFFSGHFPHSHGWLENPLFGNNMG